MKTLKIIMWTLGTTWKYYLRENLFVTEDHAEPHSDTQVATLKCQSTNACFSSPDEADGKLIIPVFNQLYNAIEHRA